MMADVDGGTLEVWPDLIRAVDQSHGVYTINMEALRRLEGAQRIGPKVITAIAERLATLGLGHLPFTLPNRGDDLVLLYRHGTNASEVIKAVHEGLNGSIARTATDALRGMNAPQEDVVSADEVTRRATEASEALSELMKITTKKKRR